MFLPTKLPLILNENYLVCPTCQNTEHLASVYRDGGSEVYCTKCRTSRWPDPRHPTGSFKFSRLTFINR